MARGALHEDDEGSNRNLWRRWVIYRNFHWFSPVIGGCKVIQSGTKISKQQAAQVDRPAASGARVWMLPECGKPSPQLPLHRIDAKRS